MVTKFLTLFAILRSTLAVQAGGQRRSKSSAIVVARNLSPLVAVLCPIGGFRDATLAAVVWYARKSRGETAHAWRDGGITGLRSERRRPALERADHRRPGIQPLRSEERRVGKECRSRWSP